MNAQVLVDPYSGKVLQVRDQSSQLPGLDASGASGQHRPDLALPGVPVGPGAAAVRVTGITMWAKKRKRRIPMTTMTDEVAVDGRRGEGMTVRFPLDAFDHAHQWCGPGRRAGLDRAKLVSIGITIAIHALILAGALDGGAGPTPR